MNYPLKAKYRGIVFFGNNEEVIKNAILKKFPNCLEDLEYISVTKNNPTVNDYKAPAKEKKKLSFKDGVTGAYALFKVATGSVVDQNELNRRANICIKCPMLVGSTNCRACGFAKGLANYIKKLKKEFGKGFVIPHGLEDKHCNVCQCALSVMLPSKLDVFKHDKDKQSERPNNCWLKKDSPNYISEN